MSVQSSYDKENMLLKIRITDQFDFSIHVDFRNAYKDIPVTDVRQIDIDMSKAEYMDSSALGMLLLLEEHFGQAKIRLLNCNPYIKQVLEISRFNTRFAIT